jgi:hypothetical protein
MQKNKASSYDSSMSLFYTLLCMQTFTKFPKCNMTANAFTCVGHLRHEPLHTDEVRAFLVYGCRDFIERYLESYSLSDFPADWVDRSRQHQARLNHVPDITRYPSVPSMTALAPLRSP